MVPDEERSLHKMKVTTKKDPRVWLLPSGGPLQTLSQPDIRAGCWRVQFFKSHACDHGAGPANSKCVMTCGKHKGARDAANVFRQSPPARDQSAWIAGDSFTHLGAHPRPTRWAFHHLLKVTSKCKCGLHAYNSKIKAQNCSKSSRRSFVSEKEKSKVISVA